MFPGRVGAARSRGIVAGPDRDDEVVQEALKPRQAEGVRPGVAEPDWRVPGELARSVGDREANSRQGPGGFDPELLLPEHPTVWAFLRPGRDASLLIAANLSADAVPVPLDDGGAAAATVLTSSQRLAPDSHDWPACPGCRHRPSRID